MSSTATRFRASPNDGRRALTRRAWQEGRLALRGWRLHALRMVGADKVTAFPGATTPRALVPEMPTLPFEPPFDLREFFGLDSWPPRRQLNALQRARIATGLTQHELAAELGVCRQTVSSIENRRTLPTVRLALAIAISLGRTVEELFAADELR